jgi:hypothetical protein
MTDRTNFGVDASLAASIAALITEFCWRVDSGDGGRVAELFTEDATLATPAFTLDGRQAIDDWFKVRADPTKRLSRHFWTNLRIAPGEEGSYTAQAYALTAVGLPPAPASGADVAIGISTDTIVVEDGRCLFSSRRLDVTYEGRIAGRNAA